MLWCSQSASLNCGYHQAKFLLCVAMFCNVLVMCCYVFVMFCDVLLCLCYVLLCVCYVFAMFLVCFALFCYVLLCFCYLNRWAATKLLWSQVEHAVAHILDFPVNGRLELSLASKFVTMVLWKVRRNHRQTLQNLRKANENLIKALEKPQNNLAKPWKSCLQSQAW